MSHLKRSSTFKAIRDGVIEAHINHEKGYVQTRDLTDVYSTLEPTKAFDQRIKFCLELRNQSVKAMRFPPKKYSEELETAEVRAFRNRPSFLVLSLTHAVALNE